MLANFSKSCLFLASVGEKASSLICHALPFNIDTLLLKYLGVPLITLKFLKKEIAMNQSRKLVLKFYLGLLNSYLMKVKFNLSGQ